MLTFIVATSLLIIFLIYMRQRPRLPPGPKGYPIIGNLLEFKPARLSENIGRLRTKFGDICCLRVVNQKIIIVYGLENLREVFVKRSHLTSDRPNTFIRIIADGYGIVGSSGKLWKEQRSFALSTLRSFGFGKRCMESQVLAEVETFVSKVEETKGEGFDIRKLSSISISNIICSLAFGQRFDHEDKKFQRLISLINANFADRRTGILHICPFLRHLPGDVFGYKAARRNLKEISEFLQDIIKEHRETLDEENIRDYIDAFLVEQKKQSENKETTFVDAQLKMTIQNLFIAGTETTATSLRWLVLFLLRYPAVQSRMRAEIDDVVGANNFPSLEMKSKLPYCEAVITESMRVGAIAGFTLPHVVTADFNYKGYSFPKGTMLLGSLSSVAQNPQVFPEPEKFDPERFLNESGQFIGHDKIVPFSLGRRVCLGESLARMELFLFLVTLVQRFELLPEDGENSLPLQGVQGTATFGPQAYKLRAVKRN